MKRAARVAYWVTVAVVFWPRVPCGWCGRYVWAWSHTRHVFDHVRAHWRALDDAYRAMS